MPRYLLLQCSQPYKVSADDPLMRTGDEWMLFTSYVSLTSYISCSSRLHSRYPPPALGNIDLTSHIRPGRTVAVSTEVQVHKHLWDLH